jgi:hypothetical protein
MIPSLLITTAASDLEKSIEEGGALSGRINAAAGRNHLTDSLDSGLPFELAHTALRKGEGEGSRGGKVTGHTKSGKPIYEDNTVEMHAQMASTHPEAHAQAMDYLKRRHAAGKPGAMEMHDAITKRVQELKAKKSVDSALDDLIKGEGEGSRGGKVIGHTKGGHPIYENGQHHFDPGHKAFQGKDWLAKRIHVGGEGHKTVVHKIEGDTAHVSDGDSDDGASHAIPVSALKKSFKRYTVPKAGAKVRKPEKDAAQKRQEQQQRKEAGLTKADQVEKALVFVIDASKDKKDPLLVNTHGEEFHTDADKETVDFLTRTGAVNPDDPVHNPPATPELNGFPLAVPLLYCSLSASDLLKAEEKKSLMQKAFNW